MLRDFLLLLVLLAGCAVTYERPDLQPAPEPSGLDLDATVEPLVLNRGDTLFVQLTVTNNSIATIVQHFGSGCIYGFGLWDSEGELVAPPPPVCTMNAPTVRYKPGGVVVRTFEWVWDDPAIEPGVYYVFAGFGPRGEGEAAPPVEVELQ